MSERIEDWPDIIIIFIFIFFGVVRVVLWRWWMPSPSPSPPWSTQPYLTLFNSCFVFFLMPRPAAGYPVCSFRTHTMYTYTYTYIRKCMSICTYTHTYIHPQIHTHKPPSHHPGSLRKKKCIQLTLNLTDSDLTAFAFNGLNGLSTLTHRFPQH